MMNILELAKEAGIMESQMWSIKGLERFAALVRAEREWVDLTDRELDECWYKSTEGGVA